MGTDLELIRERVREDLDVREMVRRRPVPLLGGAAAAAALAVAALARRVAGARRRRPLSEIDELIQRLGGRIDKLKRSQRERLREAIRTEIGEAEMGTKLERSAWLALTAGLTALATALAQSAARRFLSEAPRGSAPVARAERLAGPPARVVGAMRPRESGLLDL